MSRKSNTRKPYGTIIALVVVVSYYLLNVRPTSNSTPTADPVDLATGRYASEPAPFGAALDGTIVESVGIVGHVLEDNDDGPHQRFILKLTNGQTLLVRHNIDLSPRIENLQRGDKISFRGQFEMNDRGGLVHRTHKDSREKRTGGWLERGGKRYE